MPFDKQLPVDKLKEHSFSFCITTQSFHQPPKKKSKKKAHKSAKAFKGTLSCREKKAFKPASVQSTQGLVEAM